MHLLVPCARFTLLLCQVGHACARLIVTALGRPRQRQVGHNYAKSAMIALGWLKAWCVIGIGSAEHGCSGTGLAEYWCLRIGLAEHGCSGTGLAEHGLASWAERVNSGIGRG
ncbi:hypothetical protein BHM03_00030917 [Ensete ventricosum]|nr:hypothetical protein BHM03_00030917 [Ensete ventricosum]